MSASFRRAGSPIAHSPKGVDKAASPRRTCATATLIADRSEDCCFSSSFVFTLRGFLSSKPISYTSSDQSPVNRMRDVVRWLTVRRFNNDSPRSSFLVPSRVRSACETPAAEIGTRSFALPYAVRVTRALAKYEVHMRSLSLSHYR